VSSSNQDNKKVENDCNDYVLYVSDKFWYNPLTVLSDLRMKCEVRLVCM